MRLRTIGSITLTLATGVALTATAAAPAAAASAGGQRNCVVALTSTAAAATTAAAAPAVSCYATFGAAINHATGGRVSGMSRAGTALDAAINASNTAGATGASNRLAASYSIVIGIEYSDDDYEGDSLIYSTPYGCDPDLQYTDWYVNEFPAGWNDEIESFKSYAGCRVLYYMDSYRRGPMSGWWTSYGDLLWMNDEASSLEWS